MAAISREKSVACALVFILLTILPLSGCHGPSLAHREQNPDRPGDSGVNPEDAVVIDEESSPEEYPQVEGPDNDPGQTPSPITEEGGPDQGEPPGLEENNPDGHQAPALPKEHIIYVGQILKFPATGTPPSKSQVIQRALLPAETKQLALTFDSGWLYENTLPLLDVLDTYGIKATFFPRALWVFNPDNPKNSYPDLAREIVKRGHTMGNHSLTHPQMKDMLLDEVRHEMRESTRIIQETTGVRPFLFRPPYGEYNQEILQVLAEEGYPYTVMWTVDTHDWAEEIRGRKVTVDYIVQRVLTNASDGGIILMHVGGPKTVAALPGIIEGLRQMRYGFTTVDKMLPAPKSPEVTYTVKKGDTLFSLAQKNNTTVQKIIDYNNL